MPATESRQQVGHVRAVQAETSAVAQRRDELAVAVEQPFRVDRGQVRDAAVCVQPDGVPLGRLLRRSVLVVSGRGQI
jgi:hypothetical protein